MIVVVEIVTVAKLVPLLVLVGAGVWFVHADYLKWTAVPPLSQVGRSAIVLIYAFLGVEVALVPSGEIRDPAKTIPRAVFLALAVTTTLYLAIQAVAQGLLGPSIASYSAAPLAEATARVLGPSGRLLVLGGATVSMFGYVSGDMLGTPRVLFAFGRDGVLPAVLARVHPRFLTPHVAILTHAAVVAVLAATSSFTQLVVVATLPAVAVLVAVAASSATTAGCAHGWNWRDAGRCRFSPEPSSSGCCLRRHGANSPSKQLCCFSRPDFMRYEGM